MRVFGFSCDQIVLIRWQEIDRVMTGTKRSLIGIGIILCGFALFVGTMFENTPTPNNPPPPVIDFFDFADTMITIIIEAVIIGIGVIILAWGMRTS